jgi:hypothetical protein
MENIQPGDKVRDMVSGLVGIVVSRTRFLTGCDRVGIQLPPNKDGEIPKEFIHVDVNAVDLVEAQVVVPHKTAEVAPVGTGTPALRNPSGPGPG